LASNTTARPYCYTSPLVNGFSHSFGTRSRLVPEIQPLQLCPRSRLTIFPYLLSEDQTKKSKPNKHSIRGPRVVQTAGPQHVGIPSEFPASIEAPTAWSGTDLNPLLDNGRCCLQLDNVQIAELELASRDFEGLLAQVLSRRFILANV
jgi:hypothetical protein